MISKATSSFWSCSKFFGRWPKEKKTNFGFLCPIKLIIVPFTKTRKFILKALELVGVQMYLSEHVKYLGGVLDYKLNWNAHMSMISKATSSFWACSKFLAEDGT